MRGYRGRIWLRERQAEQEVAPTKVPPPLAERTGPPSPLAGNGSLGSFGAIGQAHGIADGGAAGRHVRGHDRASADLGEIANADVAEDGRAAADIDTAA